MQLHAFPLQYKTSGMQHHLVNDAVIAIQMHASWAHCHGNKCAAPPW